MGTSQNATHIELMNAFPIHVIWQKYLMAKRNPVKGSLLKGDEAEEEKPTSCSHPRDNLLRDEGFLATQAAIPMESNYWKDVLLSPSKLAMSSNMGGALR